MGGASNFQRTQKERTGSSNEPDAGGCGARGTTAEAAGTAVNAGAVTAGGEEEATLLVEVAEALPFALRISGARISGARISGARTSGARARPEAEVAAVAGRAEVVATGAALGASRWTASATNATVATLEVPAGGEVVADHDLDVPVNQSKSPTAATPAALIPTSALRRTGDGRGRRTVSWTADGGGRPTLAPMAGNFVIGVLAISSAGSGGGVSKRAGAACGPA